MHQIERKKLFDTAKQEYVDEPLPTYTAKVAGFVRNVTTATPLISTPVYPGSPYRPMTWMVNRFRVFTGSPETLFAVVHSRLGTVDRIYFEAPGQETDLAGDMRAPVYAFGPGTVKVYLDTPGSCARGFGVSMEGPLL